MFLPRFFLLWCWLCLTLAACGGEPTGNGAQAQPASSEAVVQVAVGSGEPGDARLAMVRAQSAVALERLRSVFPPPQPFTVFVHADRAGMPAALQPHLLPDSPAFALLGAHQVHIVLGELLRTGTSLQGTLVHEFTHELLDQYVAPLGRLQPRWFHEGLAQCLAGDTYLGAREEDLVYRVVARRLLPFAQLRDRFPEDAEELRIAYAQSYSYVHWLQQQFGLDELLAIAKAADDITSFERALVGRTRRSTLQLEDGWREHLLHGSGATWRVVLEQCFSYLLILALPLLALAMVRRFASERRAAARMATLPVFEPRLPDPLDELPAPAADGGSDPSASADPRSPSGSVEPPKTP